jgi:hypothetical protein
MALSQFDEKLTVKKTMHPDGRTTRQIEVGGPLNIAAPEDYEHPINVQFLVVQVPRGEHSEADVKRVRGMGKEVDGAPRWSGEVDLGELVPGPAEQTRIETRGVAVAVLERAKQFAVDTVTWCDEVELVEALANAEAG